MKTEEMFENFENDVAPPVICEDINNISNDFNLFKEDSNISFKNMPINNIDEKNYNLFSLFPKDENSNKCNLKLNLTPFLLNQLGKKYLVYLIQFIDSFFELKIENKYINKIDNDIFAIKKKSNKKGINKFTLYVPYHKFINYKKNKNNDNEKKKQQKIENFCENHNKKLYNYNDYNYHYIYYHKFQCDKCHTFFNYRKNLKNHICDNINYINNENDNNILDIIANETNLKAKLNKNNMVKCQECDLIFNNIELMKSHMIQFHKKISKEENKTNMIFKADNFIKTENNKINNRIIKIDNNIIIENKNKLIKKEDSKDTERNNIKEDIISNYLCQKDGKIFETEEDYIKHFQKYHPYDYPFYCKDCNKGFSNNKLLKKHLKKIKH